MSTLCKKELFENFKKVAKESKCHSSSIDKLLEGDKKLFFGNENKTGEENAQFFKLQGMQAVSFLLFG